MGQAVRMVSLRGTSFLQNGVSSPGRLQPRRGISLPLFYHFWSDAGRSARYDRLMDWRAVGRWIFCHLNMHYDGFRGCAIWKDGYYCEWCGKHVGRKWYWPKWPYED